MALFISVRFPLALFFMSILVSSAHANLNLSDVCISGVAFTPFTKWPQELSQVYGVTSNTACWWWADCAFNDSSEVRKQQFAATSLVMGLVPLTLKDIAWPERRLASIASPLNWPTDILVRALGLIPVVNENAEPVPLPRQLTGRWSGGATLVLLWLALGITYGALLGMELFSKRSSLGCPCWAFVCVWHVIALVPASLQTLVIRSSQRQAKKPTASPQLASQRNRSRKDVVEAVQFTHTPSSAIQGGEQQWWIQFSWAVYYAAGTLVYSSIMAVTVPELVVWVVLSCTTAAASKTLAFRLCRNWA